jgi:uncharacterized OsmC-like protein
MHRPPPPPTWHLVLFALASCVAISSTLWLFAQAALR